MKIDDWKEFEADCDAGRLMVRAWSKDRAGNAANLVFQTEIDSGFASFTLPQAKQFSEKLTELVREMEEAESTTNAQ